MRISHAAEPLKARLAAEQAEHIKHGVHLIVVQSADGSLVVGDSHHYAATPDPFSRDEVDALILEEFTAALGFAPPPTVERWIGTYASASDRSVLIDAPESSVRVAIVTCGAGASTGFAIGEEVISSLLGGGNMRLKDCFDLIIFDWAGTMVDFGCEAPVKALIEAFGAEGVSHRCRHRPPGHGQGETRSCAEPSDGAFGRGGVAGAS